MVKITDENGKPVAILEDQDDEPTFVEDIEDKKRKYKKLPKAKPGPGDKGKPKSQMSYYQRPLLGVGNTLTGTTNYIVSSSYEPDSLESKPRKRKTK